MADDRTIVSVTREGVRYTFEADHLVMDFTVDVEKDGEPVSLLMAARSDGYVTREEL